MTGQSIVPGTTDTGNHGDDAVTAITLPFAFNFYGTPFTTANLSSNGNLQFTSNNTAFANTCPLPTSTLDNAILPHWDDLCTGDACGGSSSTLGIFTSTSGTAPNRIFNIEWRAVYFSANATTLNFEIRLYETTGQIDFLYGTLNGTGNSATVGLQKDTGSSSSTFSCNTASLSPGLKVSWTLINSCTPSPTPTPPATFNIVGSITYCSNPSLSGVPGTTLTLSGDTTASTTSDSSGSYILSSVPSGGNYVVTPSKAALAPGSSPINTIDIVAIQRHFLVIGPPLSGCPLTAADVDGSNGVDTVDVVATQRFYLALTSGTANVGKYRFTPIGRSYNGMANDQTNQNYSALMFGDVVSPFVH